MRRSRGRRGRLRHVRTNPTDLVITDMQMPGKSGLEVLLELRALDPGCR
jgi:YesN/AraC family two-component response regulator